LPEYYPEYIVEFEKILGKNNLSCSYYGHIATGELHFSPLLDLRDPGDVEKYYNLARDVSALVKKYNGSLSGEHGDGRLRGEFIPFMLGKHIYDLLKELKRTWDPQGLFNPGKIIDTPSLVENLRYMVGADPAHIDTVFRMDGQEGFLSAVEKCSGSGDCRKGVLMGGTMCPSFMATRDEDKSTRGRANVLREFLTRSGKKNPFDHKEIFEIMDLCLSCKACKSECPSNVDMAFFKAEFLHHYYKSHHIPLRTLLIAWLPRLNRLGKLLRPFTNYLTGTKFLMKLIGFTVNRTLPSLSKVTLRSWSGNNSGMIPVSDRKNGKVYLFADEFTDFNESDIGIKAILLLEKCGYEVVIPKHRESGRTFLSKGLLTNAKRIANKNVALLKDMISAEEPLIGIEPSAILTFRDEYPLLVDDHMREAAAHLMKNSFMLDEFICREFDRGAISRKQFTETQKNILLHGHCQQKAIASTGPTIRMLSIPVNYKVEEIHDGCCGMAGSFGYEKEHYDLSMKIGELILFPVVRSAGIDTIISAPGTSCRHQIADGTGRQVFHPVEVLYDALL
jgi:Fe-S oxidoreductase